MSLSSSPFINDPRIVALLPVGILGMLIVLFVLLMAIWSYVIIGKQVYDSKNSPEGKLQLAGISFSKTETTVLRIQFATAAGAAIIIAIMNLMKTINKGK